MLKKYVAPSVTEIELNEICVLLASGGIASEMGGDGKLAPDIFYNGD